VSLQGPFAIVAGNGLTIDLTRRYADALGHWDTRQPLTWPVEAPDHPGEPLLAHLPRLSTRLAKRLTDPSLNHFEVVDEIAKQALDDPSHGDDWKASVELRHYLALAYSTFQAEVDRVSLNNWGWTTFMAANRDRYLGGASFNYDLVLERLLAAAHITFRRPVDSEPSGRMLLKPHGSIDFEYSDAAISGPVPQYPITAWTGNNNVPPRVLEPSALMSARLGPELVPPMQTSALRRFQWVGPGFDWFRERRPNLDACIFVGLSYWLPDRPEIDELIDMLSPDCTVVVANPYPPPEFMSAVEQRGYTPVVWRDGPPR
jgi:hypothetical protein